MVDAFPEPKCKFGRNSMIVDAIYVKCTKAPSSFYSKEKGEGAEVWVSIFQFHSLIILIRIIHVFNVRALHLVILLKSFQFHCLSQETSMTQPQVYHTDSIMIL